MCEIYAVEKASKGEKVMILDVGAPVSLAERSWVQKYLREFGYEIEDMVSLKCYQVFLFGGIDKKHVSTKMIELPLVIRIMTRKEEIFKA